MYVCGRVHPHIVFIHGGLRLAWWCLCLLPYSLRGVRQLALGTPISTFMLLESEAAQHLADMDSGDQDFGPQVCATSTFSTEPAQERRFFKKKKGSIPPPAPSTPTPYSEIKMSEQEFKACKISSKVYIIISILPERILSSPLQASVPYLFRNSGGQTCTDTSVCANWQWQALSRLLPLSGQMAL